MVIDIFFLTNLIYIVDSVVDTDTFTVKADTDPGTTSKFVLKHGISSNNATADDLGENLKTCLLYKYTSPRDLE